MNMIKRRRTLCLAAMLIMAFAALSAGAAGEETPMYIENEWNFVDRSMDVSNGIPEDAGGRLAKIRDSGRLTVATEPFFPPQEFIDDSQEGQARFVGADMELARLIAERMGVALEIVPMEFTEVLSSVSEGKYDLAVAALSVTAGRAATLVMSKGYYFTDEQASTGLLIRATDAETIRDAGDLAGRDIAAMSGSLQETMAGESITTYRQFVRLTAVTDVYEAVLNGEVDVGVVDLENATTYIENHPGCGLAIVPEVYFTLPQQYLGDRIAAKKGEVELMYFVNGVIDEVLESGQYERWFEEYAQDDAARD
ncbi:MAG: transporter substrate-binding domain-containing protein [Lentisphaeria bacterium]|nr:transporter substrate-binding domain-containing protein [Lentisphaeria bacterium]